MNARVTIPVSNRFRAQPVTMAFDRDIRKARADFSASRKAEIQFNAKLRKVADHIEEIVKTTVDGSLHAAVQLGRLMAIYSEQLTPWAKAIVTRMHTQVASRDKQQWRKYSAQIGAEYKKEMLESPVGTLFDQLMADQVTLIKSMPLEAAKRVHELTVANITEGKRGTTLIDEIMRQGDVSRSKAKLIARTETARTASNMTEARARAVGSTSYVWRTARDANVRHTHKKFEGKTFRWDDPPECDPGHRAHPGTIFNCFPGDTSVSLTNGCHYLWRHWYEGPLVVIQHEEGQLKLTPNHPVLTRRGWIPAEQIDSGDYVIQSLFDRTLSKEENVNKSMTTFDDLFATVSSTTESCVRVGSEFNFHGHVPDQKVDAIFSYLMLPGYCMSPIAEFLLEFFLSRTDRQNTTGEQTGECAPRPLDPSFDRKLLIAFNKGFAKSSARHALFTQEPGYCASVAFESFRNRLLAITSDIGFDYGPLIKVLSSVKRRSSLRPVGNLHSTNSEFLGKDVRVYSDNASSIGQSGAVDYKFMRVINKGLVDFKGHVYTMQTVNGWFTVTPSALVVKNCRCWAEPVIPLD